MGVRPNESPEQCCRPSGDGRQICEPCPGKTEFTVEALPGIETLDGAQWARLTKEEVVIK